MATNYPINPRVRAYGKARLDIAGRATSQAQWEKLWKHPANSFPFVWGDSWKQCIEYRVDDFPAEVGFYTDILGLPVNALDPGYAMFTSPQGDFFISVVPSPQAEQSTPPNAFRLQFMVQDIIATAQLLQQRGIEFDQAPQPLHPDSSLSIASFRTPHGLSIELWGKVKTGPSSESSLNLSSVIKNGDEEDDDEIEEDEAEIISDEDGIDEDEGDDELITKPNGNGSKESALETDEAGEDASEEELGEDQDEDDEEDFDFDEDDDDFEADEDNDDDDEGVSALRSDPQKSAASNTVIQPVDVKAKMQNKMVGNQEVQVPKYINLDIT